MRFFPQHEYTGERRFVSSVKQGWTVEAIVRRKVVDATYMDVVVPSIREGPVFPVAPELTIVPPNALVNLGAERSVERYSRYVVVGAGKTGMDAVLFLLAMGVPSELITWIVPNDAWFFNRADIMPNADNQLGQILQAGAVSSTLDQLMAEQERLGALFRLDPQVWPTKYRCATVSMEELEQLRSIERTVRLGRVLRMDAAEIVMEGGSLPYAPTTALVMLLLAALEADACCALAGPTAPCCTSTAPRTAWRSARRARCSRATASRCSRSRCASRCSRPP